MLRTKLIVAFVGLLSPAILMGLLLYWGPRQMEQRLERTLLAHNEVQAYLALGLETYRHLQQAEYEITLGRAVAQEDLSAGRDRLDEMLQQLRRLTLEELAFVGDAEPAEQEELARIARFEGLLDGAIAALGRAGADGSAEAVRREMALVDQRLGALIDDVIADETAEAEAADAQARRMTGRLTMLAIAVVAISALSALLTALWARRRIQAPIDALIEGTRTIARGVLDHRVRVFGRDELANLAVSFNWMMAELERRRIELERARADLEREVQERTRELRQSNDTLRRVDHARRRMFADISHALRTPLTVIRGEAEVTLRGRECRGQEYREALHRIVETTTQLNNLVEDLLQLARSESATLHSEPSDIVANRLVAEVVADAKALAARRGLRVTSVAPADAIRIRGDADRLRQLLLILIDNATRYTPTGGEIAIGLGVEERHAVVSVSDTGVGIPTEELDLVPGRFYRGSNVMDLAPAGAGLGLHVAQSIAEAHAGHIDVMSAPGRGTTVRLCLPLAAAADLIDERAAG
jgi:signal transduction histidine kinase